MYRINTISNHFNYDENVVVTNFYVTNENDELFRKTISIDKSDDEMKALSRSWSLTTLSINTDKTTAELTKLFGQSFKRCYVRYINNRTIYDFKNKIAVIDSLLEVSLKSDFSSDRQSFDLHSELPIYKSAEYEKHLKLDNLAGYKKV